MIKAIVFDYGGVITSGGGGNELAERFAAYLHVPLEQAKELVYKPWPRFVMGKINEEEYWQEIEGVYGKPIPVEHRMIWNIWEHMAPRPEMMTFIHDLKAQGYTVGLLSNVIPVTEKIIREQKGYELFNPCILSCKIGFAKPDIEIYKELMRKLPGVKSEEVIFVDDQQHCLDPAIKLSMATVLATSTEQIIKDTRALLENSSGNVQ